MEKPFYVLGFDIGGTKIAICLGTSDGKLIGSTRVGNQDRDPAEVLPELVAAGKKLLADTGIAESDLRAIGIGSPSPMDFEKGIILGPFNMKLWKHVAIRDYLAEAFGVEAFFDNDANAAGLAEWIFGAGQNTQNMLYLTMSTGIGAGIIANGRLLRGKENYGGEVGHMVLDVNGPVCNCGLRGDYEAFCGGKAIAQRLQEELKDKPESAIMRAAGGDVEKIDMRALEIAVREGDEYACKVWDDMIERNGQAMGMLMNIFNPEIIALGTIALRTGDLFMKPLLERVGKYSWKQMNSVCSIVTSKLDTKIGEYSGVAVALYSLYERGDWQLPWEQK